MAGVAIGHFDVGGMPKNNEERVNLIDKIYSLNSNNNTNLILNGYYNKNKLILLNRKELCLYY